MLISAFWKHLPILNIMYKSRIEQDTEITRFTAYVIVFYGRAVFNYLPLSFTGHTGVGY